MNVIPIRAEIIVIFIVILNISNIMKMIIILCPRTMRVLTRTRKIKMLRGTSIFCMIGEALINASDCSLMVLFKKVQMIIPVPK